MAFAKIYTLYKDSRLRKTINYTKILAYSLVSLSVYIFYFDRGERIILSGAMLVLMFMIFFVSLFKNPFQKNT